MGLGTGNGLLLLGVDGGGTRCRARLADLTGEVLGEDVTGPANIGLGLQESLTSLLRATGDCLKQADLD
jgi:glucosamine kinase